jgi:hypothetical protein
MIESSSSGVHRSIHMFVHGAQASELKKARTETIQSIESHRRAYCVLDVTVCMPHVLCVRDTCQLQVRQSLVCSSSSDAHRTSKQFMRCIHGHNRYSSSYKQHEQFTCAFKCKHSQTVHGPDKSDTQICTAWYTGPHRCTWICQQLDTCTAHTPQGKV